MSNWRQPKLAHDAVERYLTRPLDDWAWLKMADRATLLGDLTQHGVTWITPPRAHQAAALSVGTVSPGFYFMYDMGLGKTKIALDLIRYRLRGGGRALVLVPSTVNVAGWLQQMREHASDLRPVALVGTRQERLSALEQEADVYLINYAGLQVFMTEHNKTKRARLPVKSLVQEFAARWDVVVFDELHNIGNPQTLLYNLCRPIARATPYRYGLSGTPFGRDPMALWTQFDLLDAGETLGATLGLFRSAFFSYRENYWGGGEWNFKKRMLPHLARFVANRSLRYEDAECVDVPPVTKTRVPVHLPADAEAHYAEVVKQLRAAHGNRRETQSAFLRMRQLTAGFLVMPEVVGEDGDILEERIEAEFECPKAEALVELLREIPAEEKVVVFHEYNVSGRRACDVLKAEGIGYVELNGRTPDKAAALASFLGRAQSRVLVANSRVGGTGLNLQAARYIIFFESPVSPIVRKQAEARCTGARQSRHAFVYDLVVQGSVDERVLDFINEGQDLFEAICNGTVIL